jgi:uncharacterized protein (TIGR03067 family)
MKKSCLLFSVSLSVILSLLLIVNHQGLFASISSDESILEGKWESSQAGQDVSFTFSGKDFKVESPIPNYHYSGEFELKPNEDPKKIDMDIKESGIPGWGGHTIKGIYKIEDDILTIAINQPGAATSPTSFEHVSGAIVYILKKKE